MDGITLKAARQRLSISQDELANKARVSRITVWKWESGKVPINKKWWKQINNAIEALSLSQVEREALLIMDRLNYIGKKHPDIYSEVSKLLRKRYEL